jgi:hypothetical protein
MCGLKNAFLHLSMEFGTNIFTLKLNCSALHLILKTKWYKDTPLAHFFLVNNIHYICLSRCLYSMLVCLTILSAAYHIPAMCSFYYLGLVRRVLVLLLLAGHGLPGLVCGGSLGWSPASATLSAAGAVHPTTTVSVWQWHMDSATPPPPR